MNQGEIRCDKCVNWVSVGDRLGHCHRNPPIAVPHTTWPITTGDAWCGEFRNPQMVVDAALPKPQTVPAYHLYNLAPSSRANPQSLSSMTGMEVLDAIRASLRDYPAAGGDVVVMNEVDRIVKEAVEKAVTKRPPCQHKAPMLYCSNCRKITIGQNLDGTYWVTINTSTGEENIILTSLSKNSVKNVTIPAQKVKVDRCLCGGVGCNSCEPGGRG